MRTRILASLAVAAALSLALVAPAAQAGGNVAIGVTFGAPAYYPPPVAYYPPAPAYYPPAPVYLPPPVVYRPAPVYYGPPVVAFRYGYPGYGYSGHGYRGPGWQGGYRGPVHGYGPPAPRPYGPGGGHRY